jgi:penicillin-binding protein 2
MLNRVTNVFNDAGRPAGSGDRMWHVDARPEVRLWWLCAAFILPLLVVTGRLVHLQGALQNQFAGRLDRTTEFVEPIPSRDGRILSAGGRVLAYDIERYDVHAHYRWIEEPADPNWLRQRALARLSRGDRRRREQVATEERNVVAERNKMWSRFARLVGSTDEGLGDRRRKIQQRVERIVDRVERRRLRQQGDTDTDRNLNLVARDDPWWQVARKTLVLTLTTPPRRGKTEPVVVQEELAHHEILRDVPREVASEIEAHPERFPGLRIRLSTRRVYPARSIAAHVIGSRLAIGDDELQLRNNNYPDGDPLDYRPGDRIGKTGVERSYDRHLRGVRGRRRITKNRRGEIVQTQVVRPPRVGRDVVLTLHLPLQERMETVLDEMIGPADPVVGRYETAQTAARGGSIVVLDVHTGEILVAASAPRFDLNLLIDPDPNLWRELTADRRRPFFARATQMTLPPGSVFKTLTAVALLESGRFDPDEKVFCQGYLDKPNRYRCYIFRHYGIGHNDMDLTDAITRSCNVYFFNAARRIGPQPIVDWAKRFGFGRPTGVDLPDERGGNVPAPPRRDDTAASLPPLHKQGPQRVTSAEQRRSQKPWYPGDTLGLAIGQSRLTVTPLQIARMMAVIANGGYLVSPHVVRDFGPALGNDEQPALSIMRQPVRIEGLTEATLSRLREGLEKVVSHPRGTGYKRVRLKEISIAGKTGTAEVGGEQVDHAWFAGYVPADHPRFAFAVVLEHAGSGGRIAGPVVRQLVETMLELSILEPTRMARRE